MPSNTTRFTGTVEGSDLVGTTIFISSGERIFLAFQDPKNAVKSGDHITFRIDNMRAVDVQIQPVITAARGIEQRKQYDQR